MGIDLHQCSNSDTLFVRYSDFCPISLSLLAVLIRSPQGLFWKGNKKGTQLSAGDFLVPPTRIELVSQP